MTLVQWAIVVIAGLAGYAGVSWLIDRARGAGARQGDTAAKPEQPAQATGERSAWDEFKER